MMVSKRLPRAIYEPRGRAREYAPLALNLYSGCSHRCSYCYVPAILHVCRQDFHDLVRPRHRILEALQRDLETRRDWIGDRQVLLCFTSDPYPRAEECYDLTSRALALLTRHDVRVSILTKNPALAMKKDWVAMACNDVELGTTLTTAWPSRAKRYETNAPSPVERIGAMVWAHRMGITTWVSLEPVIWPDDSLEIIDILAHHIDLWRVGKINHNKELESRVDWSDFYWDVRRRLKNYGAAYYIKKDLLEAAGVGRG
ncbi:MAG: radical SAM protein [bacterium]